MISGLHHVTAIAGDAQTNIDFYTGVLGLRLVKVTVNFDDPGAYHLYYGDETGSPGSVLTFFSYPGAHPGRPGNGQAISVGCGVSSLDRLIDKLAALAIDFDNIENGIELKDPDGLSLRITAGDGRISTVVLSEEGYERTAELLSDVMGFQQASDFRYVMPSGSIIEVDVLPDAPQGRVSRGSIHHVAFRVADEAAQLTWREKLVDLGLNVSPVMDRDYFHSIYFREPGGVLFEIATNGPGFAIDESELGSALKLPAWLEPQRASIEKMLPPIKYERVRT